MPLTTATGFTYNKIQEGVAKRSISLADLKSLISFYSISIDRNI